MEEKKVQAEGVAPSADEELERLLRSKVIRAVHARKVSPRALDRRMKKLEKQVEELQTVHALDMSEIVRLRRQVEFLIGHDNQEV